MPGFIQNPVEDAFNLDVFSQAKPPEALNKAVPEHHLPRWPGEI